MGSSLKKFYGPASSNVREVAETGGPAQLLCAFVGFVRGKHFSSAPRRLAIVLAAALLPVPALGDPPPSPPLAGGWSEVAKTDPELQAVARFVVPRLPRRHPRLLRIEGGERQVVAGMNYRIALQLTDRSRWRAQVWRRLDGTYQLTRSERIR